MTSISGTRIFRPGVFWSVVVSFFLVVGVFAGIQEGYWVALLLSPVVAITAWWMIACLGCQVTTNHDGVTRSMMTRWGTNVQFGWDEVASWHFCEWNDPESGDASFVQFDFVDPRKPIIITAHLVEVPGLDAFVREVRERIPDREELSKVETFRWRAVVTQEGLNLTGSILNHVYFR